MENFFEKGVYIWPSKQVYIVKGIFLDFLKTKYQFSKSFFEQIQKNSGIQSERTFSVEPKYRKTFFEQIPKKSAKT